MRIDKPCNAVIPQRPDDKTKHADFVLGNCEPCSPGDVPALLIPLTQDCRDLLFDRLVTIFSGMGVQERYNLASIALSAIGVEVKAKNRKAAA